ncbi:alpha/beta hydrolase family protein [Crocosphaera sp. Alani8]|uniref:alpha/beta hydrolase family protein n=1 Tax=Crocosphaera sp. Alani8 TaxID=3038952 RepID=UPI00313B5D7B
MSLQSLISSVAVATFVPLMVVESSLAEVFDPRPLFDNFDSFTTLIPGNGDLADIYYPRITENSFEEFPVVVLLQGAFIDKSFYSEYAAQVSRYGFVVAVPNRSRFIPGLGVGLFSEVGQIDETINALKLENNEPSSQLFGLVDTERSALLGHSFGAAVGLSAIGNLCLFLICDGSFERPASLLSGAFFGANLRNQITNEPIPIANDGISIALLQGDIDGVASFSNAEATFDSIATPPATLVTLAGINHFGITNENNPDGTSVDPNIPTVPQAVSIETIARLSGLFLRATTLDDSEAFDYIFDTGADLDPNVSAVEVLSVPEPHSLWWQVIFCAFFFFLLPKKH